LRKASAPEGRDREDSPASKPGSGQPHYAGHRDRLRQRFLTQGADALSDYELLELILFSAIPRQDVKPLAKRLLAEFGGLGALLSARPEELERRGGIGLPTIALLKAVGAASLRILKAEVIQRPVIGSWDRLLDYLGASLRHEKTEQFRLLFLDRKNALIADELQQRGTVDQAPVYPREVVKRALELEASAVILVHNHPSGDPTPSRADIEITREVARALETVGIALHDHLIVGRSANASLRALGLI